MSMTLGLVGDIPYILNSNILPTNTEIIKDQISKGCDKCYIDNVVSLNMVMPFISNPLLENEVVVKGMIDKIKEKGITSIKTLTHDMIMLIDYTLLDSLGNSVSSEIKISDINLSNIMMLSDNRTDDVLSYRHVNKITGKVNIDIRRDKNLGIKFQPVNNLPYTLKISSVNIFTEILNNDNVFDNIIDIKYKEKVLNYIKNNYDTNKTMYDSFINKYFKEEYSPDKIAQDYNRFWSCKDDYKYPTQYLLDMDIMGKNGIDIINKEMFDSQYPTGLQFEIKDTNKIVINLDIFMEMGIVSNVTSLEDIIIANKAKLDNIDFTAVPVPPVINPPNPIETPITNVDTKTDTTRTEGITQPENNTPVADTSNNTSTTQISEATSNNTTGTTSNPVDVVENKETVSTVTADDVRLKV